MKKKMKKKKIIIIIICACIYRITEGKKKEKRKKKRIVGAVKITKNERKGKKRSSRIGIAKRRSFFLFLFPFSLSFLFFRPRIFGMKFAAIHDRSLVFFFGKRNTHAYRTSLRIGT